MFVTYKILDSSKDTFDMDNLSIISKCDNLKEYNPKIWIVNKYFLLQNGWSFVMLRNGSNESTYLLIDTESDKISDNIQYAIFYLLPFQETV